MSYLLKELNIDMDINTGLTFESTWHRYNDVLQRILSVKDPVVNYEIIPAINLLEYQVAVYGIFIERYMNPRWKLIQANVDAEEEIVKSIIRFFYKWYATEVDSNRVSNIPSRVLESRYIAEQTHNNMNVLCKGY